MPDLIQTCKQILSQTWKSVEHECAKNPAYNAIDDKELRETIEKCINSQTKTYRYVLPTQLVAKMADPSLDSRCLQVSRGGDGCFDARSVCDEVIVPFDREHHNVLGGAPEPYVSNPLRVPEISEAYKAGKKDKEGWDNLIFVLGKVETVKNENFTELVFEQTLVEIFERLSTVQITYPVPKRISLVKTQELIDNYLSVPSGGERALSLVSSLMETIGEEFDLFKEVRRGTITAADASSGMVADIECRDADGNILLAVEVKDKELIINHIESKMTSMRSKQVSEILYIAQHGINQNHREKIDNLINREFVSGQNIYVFEDIKYFSSGILALIGEQGRRKFLEKVGITLDRYGAAIQHRRDWAHLLSLA